MNSEIARQISILKNQRRPNTRDYIEHIFTDFIEIHGDRLSKDDLSILCGIGCLEGTPVTVIGQMRGKNLEEQINYNFSMTHPEGFRKSLRLMLQAEKFNRPVICFVDTIGAYMGESAEEHGQVVAIANNLKTMMFLNVPIITVIIGNGGSGGALALCVADKIVVLENAVLSTISPKACAEILWKDMNREIEAATILKMSSQCLLKQGIADYVIAEPDGGNAVDVQCMARSIKKYLIKELRILSKIKVTKLVKRRYKKYREMGRDIV